MDFVKEIIYNRDTNKFIVFVSYYSLNEPIYRVIENNDHFNSYIEFNGKRVIGEDPRPFILNNQKTFISQRFVDGIHTMNQNIVNYESGNSYKYIVKINNFNYGKNWTPFVVNNNLFFIHCFDPFTLIHNNEVIIKIATNLEKCVSDNFTSYRGGTNGLVYNNYIFGIGHFTPCFDDHRPFLWVIDLNKNTFELGQISDYKNKQIYSLGDPTSLWIENRDIYCSIFESYKGWYHLDTKCISRIFKIDFDNLYGNIKNEKSYKIFNLNCGGIISGRSVTN
uniref:Uncharacterized protein n=1 Tax=viral metagenome TaxID=1070528 RepID=A0A6C0KST1_9ZZZZ